MLKSLCLVLALFICNLEGARYYQRFVYRQNVVSGSPQCTSFKSFINGMPSNIGSIRAFGSRNQGGYRCSDPAAAQRIVTLLKTCVRQSYGVRLCGTVACGNMYWDIGSCSNSRGSPVELNVDSRKGQCQCTNQKGVILRPCIGNYNFGGVDGPTCSAPTQYIGVEYTPGSIPNARYYQNFRYRISSGNNNVQCRAYKSFIAGIPNSGVTSFKIFGSRNMAGNTCTDSNAIRQLVTILKTCRQLRRNVNRLCGYVRCAGKIFDVGTCYVPGRGSPSALTVSNSRGSCSCAQVPGGASLRACIGNLNWGGVNGPTCYAPSQGIGLEYKSGGPVRYYEQFTYLRGTGNAQSQCQKYKTFINKMPSSGIRSLKVFGSRDQNGNTCNDVNAIRQIVTLLKTCRQIQRYRNRLCGFVRCNNKYFEVGTCHNSAGSSPELTVSTRRGQCYCATMTGAATLRPCIGNYNWGGVNGPNCRAPTQAMGIEYVR